MAVAHRRHRSRWRWPRCPPSPSPGATPGWCSSTAPGWCSARCARGTGPAVRGRPAPPGPRAERWARRAGTVPDATTAITRLAWLRRTDPDTFRRIGTVLLPHEWLTFWLTGRAVTDRGSASCTWIWSPTAEGPGRRGPRAAGRPGPRGLGLHLPEVLGAGRSRPTGSTPRCSMARGAPGAAAGRGPGTAGTDGCRPGPGATCGRWRWPWPSDHPHGPARTSPSWTPSGAVHSRADATGRHLAGRARGRGRGWSTAMAELLDLHVAESLGQWRRLADPPMHDVVVVPGVRAARRRHRDRPRRPGTGRDEVARATFEGVAGAARFSASTPCSRPGCRWARRRGAAPPHRAE